MDSKTKKELAEIEKDIFTIQPIAQNHTIGLIDLGAFDWVAHQAWVGIGLGERDFWGHGFGTDAMQVLLRYVFMELNLKLVNLTVFE